MLKQQHSGANHPVPEGRCGYTEGDKGNAFPLEVQMGSSASREY